MPDGTELLVAALVILVILVLLASAIKIVREYERLVIFRLGRLLGAKGPGVALIVPMVDKRVLVDLRVLAADVPKQRVVTRDNVSVEVDAVVYYRVQDPIRAIVQVQSYALATNLLAQTTLRDILGQVDLDDLLSKREDLNRRIQVLLDTATDPWGIKVSSVTIRDVALPDSMIRAIAKQAEAERERRSRIIMAEGEFQAAQRMRDASELYGTSPAALRLREFQMLADIAREKNLIVVTSSGATSIADIAALTQALARKKEKG